MKFILIFYWLKLCHEVNLLKELTSLLLLQISILNLGFWQLKAYICLQEFFNLLPVLKKFTPFPLSIILHKVAVITL